MVDPPFILDGGTRWVQWSSISGLGGRVPSPVRGRCISHHRLRRPRTAHSPAPRTFHCPSTGDGILKAAQVHVDATKDYLPWLRRWTRTETTRSRQAGRVNDLASSNHSASTAVLSRLHELLPGTHSRLRRPSPSPSRAYHEGCGV